MKEIRIATQKNGRKYVVAFIDFKRKIVRVHGEVCERKHAKTYHEKGFNLPLSDVEITKVEKTSALCEKLFDQWIEIGQEKGKFDLIKITGKKNRCYHIKRK